MPLCDAVFLLANGTINRPSVDMFDYQAHHELSTLGKSVQRTCTASPKSTLPTIAASDPLDGRIDGVVSRSGLCKLKLDLTSIVEEPYSYAAAASSINHPGGSTSAIPAQKSNVSAHGVEVARLPANSSPASTIPRAVAFI